MHKNSQKLTCLFPSLCCMKCSTNNGNLNNSLNSVAVNKYTLKNNMEMHFFNASNVQINV